MYIAASDGVSFVEDKSASFKAISKVKVDKTHVDITSETGTGYKFDFYEPFSYVNHTDIQKYGMMYLTPFEITRHGEVQFTKKIPVIEDSTIGVNATMKFLK